MKTLHFIRITIAGLLIFSQSSFSQIPVFSEVPNMYSGDSAGIVALIKNGIEIKKGKAVCWFPKDSLSLQRMNEIADTMNIGIVAAEKYLKAPLSWQSHEANAPYTYYFRPEFFISHASLAGFVSIPFWRIKSGKAPWLHETMHEMLAAKGNSWYSKDITDEYASKYFPHWLFEGLPDYVSKEVSKQAGLPQYDVFSAKFDPDVDSFFINDMKSETEWYIVSFIGSRGIMPELSGEKRQQYAPGFYHGSCSFVQFIARRYGLSVLLDAISSFQKEHEFIETKTGKSIDKLKSEWSKHLNLDQ